VRREGGRAERREEEGQEGEKRGNLPHGHF